MLEAFLIGIGLVALFELWCIGHIIKEIIELEERDTEIQNIIEKLLKIYLKVEDIKKK
jgi:uncharacterized membrane protein